MTHLQRIEQDILAEHGRICLRPTLDTAGRIGGLLADARPLVPHGQWLAWLRRVGLSRQSASDYLAVHTHSPNVRPAGHMTIKRFLTLVRTARRSALRAERERVRDEMAERTPATSRLHRIVHADCRTYRGWPRTVDVIATDPPWADPDAYSWLGRFAADRLRPGGLLLCQCGTVDMADRLHRLTAAGLTYYWTLAMVFAQTASVRTGGHAAGGWRPVLCLSQGRPSIPAGFSDVFTVRADMAGKRFHDWQQPLKPWTYWLGRLTLPGCVIVDPFAGSATVGVAVRECGGGRRYLGTEIVRRTAAIARSRLAECSA